MHDDLLLHAVEFQRRLWFVDWVHNETKRRDKTDQCLQHQMKAQPAPRLRSKDRLTELHRVGKRVSRYPAFSPEVNEDGGKESWRVEKGHADKPSASEVGRGRRRAREIRRGGDRHW
jgi:hypothetical protein